MLTKSLSKSSIGLLLASIAIGATAQITDIQAPTPYSAYLQDNRGVIVRNPFGLCWHTGYWTPADAVAGCDGPLVTNCTPPQITVGRSCVTPPAEAAPPAAAPETPQRAPAAAIPAPAAPKRCDFAVTLVNDQTFGFNKSILSAAAKKRIDEEVVSKLDRCANVDFVVVTGHTDRLGSQQYNQKLSEKRADAVANYLKQKGVSANMDTLGLGKTLAVKSCDDKLPRKQLIECLTPNRRVVIEVKGLAK